MLHRPIGKLIIAVLVPNCLQVKVRAADAGLEECQVAGVRDRLGDVVKAVLERQGEQVALDLGVVVVAVRALGLCRSRV